MGVKRFYRLWTESKAKETTWLPMTQQCSVEVIPRRARVLACPRKQKVMSMVELPRPEKPSFSFFFFYLNNWNLFLTVLKARKSKIRVEPTLFFYGEGSLLGLQTAASLHEGCGGQGKQVMSNFATPWTAAHQAPLSCSISQRLLKVMSVDSAMLSNHVLLCCPFLLLPSVFPSIGSFSSESALWIRWPKFWSFSISPSNEYSGLISFTIDWFGAVQEKPSFSLLINASIWSLTGCLRHLEIDGSDPCFPKE